MGMNKLSIDAPESLREVIPSYFSFNRAAQIAEAKLPFQEHQGLSRAELAAASPQVQRLGKKCGDFHSQ